MKSRNMKANLHSKMMPKKESSKQYFNRIDEVSENIYDEADKDITRFFFLLEGKEYLTQL